MAFFLERLHLCDEKMEEVFLLKGKSAVIDDILKEHHNFNITALRLLPFFVGG